MPRGTPSIITAEVVRRVGELFGKGIPLRHCLALERDKRINRASFQKALQRSHELRDAFDLCGADFAKLAVERLVNDPDARNLRWVLERRFPSDFGTPSNVTENHVQVTVNGLPSDLVSALQASTRAAMKEKLEEKRAAKIKVIEVESNRPRQIEAASNLTSG